MSARLRPDRWRFLPEWYRNWRGIRRSTSRKALAQRVAEVERRNRAVLAALAAVVEASGNPAAVATLHGAVPGRARRAVAERHLTVVRSDAS